MKKYRAVWLLVILEVIALVFIGINHAAYSPNAKAGAEDTTARIDGLLADADNSMKRVEEMVKIWGIDNVDYYALKAIYTQNKAIIELLRQKENK